MKLDLNDSEVEALVGLIDAGVRATGLRGVQAAAVLISKIESAKQAETDADEKEDNHG